MARKYRLADYRQQANRLPFAFEIDDDTTLIIPPPTATVMLDVAATTDLRTQMQLMTGDQFEKLMDALGDEQGAVLKPLLKDLSRHFGLGE